VIAAREEKVRRQLAIQENVYSDFKKIKDAQRVEKYGSFPYKDDDELAHGNFYQTINRRVHPEPDPKKDPNFMEGNYIDRIAEADERRQKIASNVLPMTEEEKRAVEERRTFKKMPQKAPLDECDMITIRNYIDDAKETV